MVAPSLVTVTSCWDQDTFRSHQTTHELTPTSSTNILSKPTGPSDDLIMLATDKAAITNGNKNKKTKKKKKSLTFRNREVLGFIQVTRTTGMYSSITILTAYRTASSPFTAYKELSSGRHLNVKYTWQMVRPPDLTWGNLINNLRTPPTSSVRHEEANNSFGWSRSLGDRNLPHLCSSCIMLTSLGVVRANTAVSSTYTRRR